MTVPNRKTRTECTHRDQAAALRALLRQARNDRNMSQQDLATGAGVSVGTVRALEGNRTVDPSFFTVLAIARYLGVRPEQLIEAVETRAVS